MPAGEDEMSLGRGAATGSQVCGRKDQGQTCFDLDRWPGQIKRRPVDADIL